MALPTPHNGHDRDEYEARGSLNESASEMESTGGLLSRLMSEVATLFRKEMALAKAELTQAATQTKRGVMAMAAGGAVLFAGGVILLAALVLLLAEFLAPWLAALIVGAVLALVGYTMLQIGKKKFTPATLKPERTQESLRKDKDVITRRNP